MSKKHVWKIGKVDYMGHGVAYNMAELEWDLTDDGNFSMMGGIWNANMSDYVCCGQMVDELASYFPRNQLVQEMCEVWKRWHLNDLKAGSPAQRQYLRNFPPEEWDYGFVCDYLADAGLHPDESYEYNGEPYRYGSAWLKEEIPPDVIEKIKSWPERIKQMEGKA